MIRFFGKIYIFNKKKQRPKENINEWHDSGK